MMGTFLVCCALVVPFMAICALLGLFGSSREVRNKRNRDAYARGWFKTYPHELRDGTILMYPVTNVDAVDQADM